MKVIPAVDVLDGAVVRLEQGRYDAITHYRRDPGAQVSSFADEGADLVHVVDLDAARSGRPNPGVWAATVGRGAAIQAGGGIRTPHQARRLIELGIARVVVGTAAVRSDGQLEEIAEEIGPDALVAGVDVRDGRVRGSGWTDRGRPLAEVLSRLLAAGVRRALVTGIETDGTMHGPNRMLLAEVRDAAPELRIIASGGVGALRHVRALARDGWEAVIIGRALYEGAFTYAAAVEAARGAE